MRKRTLARECSLKILYQAEIAGRGIKLTAQNYWQDNGPNDKTVQNFANNLLQGIDKNFEEVNKHISECATNWQMKRMAIIDKNILRMGVYELLYVEDVPPKVTINECVELAKKYGDVDSSKFVNGVLDKIHKKNNTPEESKDA